MSDKDFDAIIIGSGFGGSVMAYRLAEAGLRVCLLERGKAYPPNSFARAPYDMSRNFWDPTSGLFGMFDIWSFKGSGALVSSGLGGGSLIYANIHLRKDPKWFKEDKPGGGYEPWPVSYDDLEPHYERVEKMMNVQQYPLTHAPYNETGKTHAMRDANRDLKLDDNSTHQWLPLNLAVSFRRKNVNKPDEDDPANPPIVGAEIPEEQPNYHAETAGRAMPRSTCRLCGECDIGCNYGSKNTLDYTYISAAIHQKPHPLKVETLCDVKEIAPLTGGGYGVEFARYDPALEPDPNTGKRPPAPRERLTCDRLILAAGTYGTPFLLLRNAAKFPGLNTNALGSRFSVNGDLLSFILGSREIENGRSVPRRIDPSFGPVITSAIRVGDTLDGQVDEGRGFYTEDGGNPYLMSWFAELRGLPEAAMRLGKFAWLFAKYRIGKSHDADLSKELSDLLGRAEDSMSSFPVLTMGRDHANGELFLDKKGMLQCDWHIKKSKAYYDRVRKVGQAIAIALKAEYEDNPAYGLNFHQVLTAHPLGGAPMGATKGMGVVNAYGQVFDCPGLYVVDGSAMPGPVGPNPSLTIAAFSDRCADRIIEDHKGVAQ